jgi:hypothetical protein
MKTLLSFLILMGFFSQNIAQTVSQVQNVVAIDKIDSSTRSNESMASTALADLKQKHNNKFIEQINEFISEFIHYPKELLDYRIEGTMVIKMLINEKGEIQAYKIEEGLDSKLDSVVMSQFQQFTRIELKENEYFGNRAINVPVNFSIDH